ncbi:MAG TPA: alpha/beta hydrolase [Petrotogaceae bacterium]|jgi:hypothetical protein|nr:alpha/beta hydrolase [Petrotogaceae bacterium]
MLGSDNIILLFTFFMFPIMLFSLRQIVVMDSSSLKKGIMHKDCISKSLESSEDVEVERKDKTVFSNKHLNMGKGLIFYPEKQFGSLSYGPLMRRLAEEGIFCVLIDIPYIVYDPLKVIKPAEIIENYPGIKDWYIAGHSSGGRLACSYIKDRTEKISGLILLGAYPDSQNSLEGENIRVLSIYAGKDKMSPPLKVEKAKEYLPKETEYYFIPEGDGVQFSCSLQSFESSAGIGMIQQQNEIFRQMLEFILEKDGM